ncbi:MAG: PBECR4 domain-containing protein [Oscillospiraceae bacterium]|nr:PBECR4 domain-containing protein [Oscillospiraceae bacterium]
MDKLKASAEAFQQLLNKEYLIKLGHRGKATEFSIVFETVNFKHLTGIHYLKDIDISDKTPKEFFIESLSGALKEKDLYESIYFDQISERLENLKNLENYLDNNMLVFKWDLRNATYSKINADYMLKEDKPENKAYVFLKEKSSIFGATKKLKVNEIKKESAISFFLSNKNYDKNQVQYTLLKNEKIDRSKNIRVVLYDFEEMKKKRLSPPEKETAPPKLTDFEICRDFGKTFTVKLNETIKQYELTDGADNIKAQTDKIAADFNISESQAHEIFDNAYEQNTLEANIAKSEQNQDLPDIEKTIDPEKELTT